MFLFNAFMTFGNARAVYDGFDVTTSLTHAESGQAWNYNNDVNFFADADGAGLTADSGWDFAWAESGLSDCVVEWEVSVMRSDDWCYFGSFRVQDATNGFWFRIAGTSLQVYESLNASLTLVADAALTPSVGDRYRVVLDGSDIKTYHLKVGTTFWAPMSSIVSTHMQTQTSHGLLMTAGIPEARVREFEVKYA